MTARTLRTYEAAALGGKLPRRAVLLLAALLAASFALAPRAEAFVYWGGDTPGYPIGRANLDGTSMDTSFIWLGSQPACEMASDGKHLYWAHRDVGRANLPDGTGVDATFIDVVDEAGAIAVDPEYVYWTNWDNPYVLGDSSAIGRADHDGSNVDQSFISLPAGPWGLAVDGGHIYWTDAYKIGRADLDGSNVDPNFIDLPTTFPTGLAVNATHIFFSHTGSSIGRANLNGTGVDASFITDVYPPYPHGVAVDGAHVYWANPNRLGGPLIGRADVDGSNVDRSFISEDPRQPFFPPCGVAVDALPSISFVKVKKNMRKGTARLTVKVPGPGELDLAKTKKVKAAEESAFAAGTENLLVKARGKAKKKLNAKGKVTVNAKVTYTPEGGEPPNTESKKINLIRLSA